MQNGDMVLSMREYASWEEWRKVARKQARALGVAFEDMLPPPLHVIAKLGPEGAP